MSLQQLFKEYFEAFISLQVVLWKEAKQVRALLHFRSTLTLFSLYVLLDRGKTDRTQKPSFLGLLGVIGQLHSLCYSLLDLFFFIDSWIVLQCYSIQHFFEEIKGPKNEFIS